MYGILASLGTASRFGGRGQQGHDQRRGRSDELLDGEVDGLRSMVQSGVLDPDQLREKLSASFGADGEAVVGDDGTVDFEGLAELMRSAQAQELQDRLHARFGDAADGLVDEDGTIDERALQELFLARSGASRPERAGNRARDRRLEAPAALEILAELAAGEARPGPAGLFGMASAPASADARSGDRQRSSGPGLSAPFIELNI